MHPLITAFEKIYNSHYGVRIFFSPGRVNLIGEHIDYNGGLVFPAAISMGTYGVVVKRIDLTFRMYSSGFIDQGLISFDINELTYKKEHGWVNYAKGVLHEIRKMGYNISHGFDLYVSGDLPTQSGLSSSASLEVLVCYIANDFYHLNLTRKEIALLGQRVENEYMGMHCGIMDQLSIACGVKSHGLLMNTATLEINPTPVEFAGFTWLIMNTNYKRKTTESKYNERVSECMIGLTKIRKFKEVTHLCELSLTDLNWIEDINLNPTIYKRVKHVITEQDRTIKAKMMMETNNAMGFAELMNQSHSSLKTDYEVTGKHLDILVSEALKNGAIGARVTGAGFGGCAISLVKSEYVNDVKNAVYSSYSKQTGIIPDFYTVSLVDGVQEIELSNRI